MTFLYWSIVFLFPKLRTKFVRNYLELQLAISMHSDTQRNHLYSFVENYLDSDGYFLMRVIAKIAGAAVTAEIFAKLWDDFQSDNQTKVSERNGDEISNHQSPRQLSGKPNTEKVENVSNV